MNAPILEGKLDTWKQFAEDWANSGAGAGADYNQRHGLTRHRTWLTETPSGPAVIVLTEGSGAGEELMKVATSDHEDDVRFREFVKDVHGMDLTQPPPGPLPELVFDLGG